GPLEIQVVEVVVEAEARHRARVVVAGVLPEARGMRPFLLEVGAVADDAALHAVDAGLGESLAPEAEDAIGGHVAVELPAGEGGVAAALDREVALQGSARDVSHAPELGRKRPAAAEGLQGYPGGEELERRPR